MKSIIEQLNIQQRRALSLIMQGMNVFITGGAGTGKSFLIQAIQSLNNRDVVVCAPTGTAAEQIKGVTLHHLLHAPTGVIGPNIKPCEENALLDASRMIIIDEISMVRFDLFNFFLRSVRASEMRTGQRKNIVLVGDFFQLSPVITQKDADVLEKIYGYCGRGFAFNSWAWQEISPAFVELTQQMRQTGVDSSFREALNSIRFGNKDALHFLNTRCLNGKDYTGTLLCARRSDVDRINKTCIEEIYDKPAREYPAVILGSFDTKETIAETHLSLKVGVPVVILVNDTLTGLYVNGTRGVITQLGDNYVKVGLENGGPVITLNAYEWSQYKYEIDEDTHDIQRVVSGTMRQIPVIPAYAMTIHKAQGLTLNEVTISSSGIWAPGMLYTALSRVRTMDDLHLLSPIKDREVIVDISVEEFYDAMRRTSLIA